ncbi:SPRY domain-containing protein 7 isoform X1 [Monodelphis domestica]|uniref:SPRY domain-containing protein 7 isoform X1 n=1 Tax=Monodelphis domestica TaxID=13616 RepID=UPI0024E1A148|nr:SPRY domain-containing protein 7 isoform X1 [Monodelphis domestica]
MSSASILPIQPPPRREGLSGASLSLEARKSRPATHPASQCRIQGKSLLLQSSSPMQNLRSCPPKKQSQGEEVQRRSPKGIWGIGVATQKVNLNQIPLGRDVHSLVMRNDGALYHNNEEKNRLPANNLPQEGDVVGITYDHVELNVYLNGKNMHCPASGIRGTVYPVVYVDDSAILDCQFSDFYHIPPTGFEKILFEQQIF